MQGKTEAPAAVKARFDNAWKRSGVSLTASRFMGRNPPPLQKKEQPDPAARSRRCASRWEKRPTSAAEAADLFFPV
ncbi:MAG: hypothetical protein P8185_18760 [Deltaproteobacteria bacterium]